MLMTVGMVVENWVLVCLEFGRSKKATISCGYPISAPTGTEEEHPQMKTHGLCSLLVLETGLCSMGMAAQGDHRAPWGTGAAPLTLQQPLLHWVR